MTIQQEFNTAVELHRSGRLNEAEEIYRQILSREPNHVDTLHLLGVLASESGRHEMAIDLIRQAILHKPDFAKAHFTLGNAFRMKGEWDQAIRAYRQAVALNPRWPEAQCNLGAALYQADRLDEAIEAYRCALAVKPDLAQVHYNLGSALRRKGRVDEAIITLRRAVALKVDYAQAHCELGNALKDRGYLEESIAAYHKALALNSDYYQAHNNLGLALEATGNCNGAIAAYQKSLSLHPLDSDAHLNLGNALQSVGRLDEAMAAYCQAIKLNPTLPEAHNGRGSVLKEMGELEQAIAAFGHALALKPDFSGVHCNLVLDLHYGGPWDAAAIALEHRQWDRQHAEPLKKYIRPHANDREANRRLRIGYVSPDLRYHVVGRFLLPLLANHDHGSFEIFAYAQVPVLDDMSRRMQSHTDGWRSLVGLSDSEAADLIRRDRIDILVDLAGHTANNRLLVFAHKPAPIQATCLGYPNTTGLSTMDYRLTDAHADPPGQTELYHTEKLIRLSSCAWCYQPSLSPPIQARQEGPITFGCFNAFAKVTEPMLLLWAEILRTVPESRLLLKSAGLGSARVRLRVGKLIQEAGADLQRVEMRGKEPDRTAHLNLYGQMDIALDTFPYQGTTTTCEALWMGVPVVSLAGLSHVSRVGVSLLNNVGLPELVAKTPDEYLQIAVALANDRPRLWELRSSLRQRMEASPLMDAPRLAREIEKAYRGMWREWCGEV